MAIVAARAMLGLDGTLWKLLADGCVLCSTVLLGRYLGCDAGRCESSRAVRAFETVAAKSKGNRRQAAW